MVILPTTRSEAIPVTISPDDQRCVAIAKRYGSVEELYLQVMNSAPSAETPSTVLCMMTYGPMEIKRQLASRMKMCAVRMGEQSLDSTDAEIIGGNIADDPTGRILGYDLVMGFFLALERGEYPLYSCSPRHVMAAWQMYAKAAHTIQVKLKDDAEKAQRDREWEEHRKNAITFEEYKKRQTIH